MAIHIELSPEKENTLREEAARLNVPVNEYARALVEQHLPTNTEEANGWPSGFFEETFGSLADEPAAAERLMQGRYEQREPIS